jgi:hypothetical protein
MKTIIENIFVKFGFNRISNSGDIYFYENSNIHQQSYFITHFVSMKEMGDYLEGDGISKSLSLFESQKKLKADVDKNTSLIIVLELDDIAKDFQACKNRILEIEEDEFWFKKYVLLYSPKSVASFISSSDPYTQIKECILDNSKFALFKENMFSDIEYFTCLQIFLKFPFLNVPVSLTEHYLSIDGILKNNLDDKKLGYLDRIINEIDSMDDNYWASLRSAALDSSANETLDLFFTSFNANDKDS